MIHDLSKLAGIKICEPKTREYRLLYRWGAWVTHCKIFAESDLEAIHDARDIFETTKTLKTWPYEVALFETGARGGWRRIKTFKKAVSGAFQAP